MMRHHRERHRSDRVGWLRAAVLGANDGIVSTASLVLGVAAAHSTEKSILVAGVAGLVAGAMSMATGEYVSVYSQADAENADRAREKEELKTDPIGEHKELAGIYESRGLDAALAKKVADQLMEHNALEAHMRDELGVIEKFKARPLQAAITSALSFAVGAALPLAVVTMSPPTKLLPIVTATCLVCLAVLGGIAAQVGGANMLKGSLRVTFWSALAMALSMFVGSLVGTAV